MIVIYFGMLIDINLIMPTKRTKLSINKTLLILLGIILACLLTLNASSFYSAETLSFPKTTKMESIEKNVKTDLIEKIGANSIKTFLEKVTSLK